MGRETFYQSRAANSTAWMSLVEIDDAQGEVIEVGVGNMRHEHAIKVNADGREVLNEVFKTQNQGTSQSRTLNIAFDESLSVEVMDVYNPEPQTQFFANYALEIPPSSIIERGVNQIEARTGVSADIILAIIGIILTLSGIQIGSMSCPIPTLGMAIPILF